MVLVSSTPVILPCGEKAWQFEMPMGQPFDYSIPFRAALSDIAEILAMAGNVVLDIPAYSPDEDFIEGALFFNDDRFDIYYEHSLAFLTFKHSDCKALEDLRDRILPRVKVR